MDPMTQYQMMFRRTQEAAAPEGEVKRHCVKVPKVDAMTDRGLVLQRVASTLRLV